MFHKAVELKFQKGTELEVLFEDGSVILYDISALFEKYPRLETLNDRSLFISGRLLGYGIIWNDDLDIETETIYEEGRLLRKRKPPQYLTIGKSVLAARAEKGLSQKELAEISGIDQSDLSRIERGIANPSVKTLMRIAEALNSELCVTFNVASDYRNKDRGN